MSTEKKPALWKQLTAGTAGGVAITLVGHPLDTIKVRLQTDALLGEQKFKSALDCFKQTLKAEGPFGLYKGVTSPMFGSAALYAVCFGSFGIGKKIFGNSTPFELFNAGCFSGIFSTTVMTPMELVKVKLQLQFKSDVKQYSGALDCAKQIYKEMGIKGIYKGTASTLMRDVPGSGVYFAAYEIIRNQFIPKGGSTRDLKLHHYLFAGGCAGLAGWVVMLPPDTIKSRIQASPTGTYKGMYDCFQQLVKKEGYGSLYKGIGPVFLRAFPANAATFFAYEVAMKFLNKVSE
jgi:solute carrier family 25 carnitine/acylcarnitine transporter 20/29